ncbi:MAG: Ig-like domain-containing protein [Rufibacter sp.]
MKKQLINAISIVSLFFLGACASIGSPEGGPKDETAPKLLSTYPRNGQTNVKPEKIVLTFDEPIQALDLNRQLIIAPYRENTFKTKIKDGILEITFTEPWKDSTTYSLNFRNSMADITEKNPAKNVIITFSTGSYLDSGRVAGTVSNLFSPTLPKEVNVLLYAASDTAQIQKGRPLYVTSPDSTGKFSFQNIREGNYYIYALAETNNNLRYDNERELIAYTKDSIQVRPKAEGIQLILHTQDNTPPRAISRRSFTNVYETDYNEGLTAASFSPLGATGTILYTLANNGKTVRIFPSTTEEKNWLIQVTDSAANTKTDTLNLRFTGKIAPRTKNTFEVLNGTTIKPGDTLKLGFEVPTKIIDPNGAVSLLIDTVTTVTSTSADQLRWNQNQTQLTLRIPFEAKRQISITTDTTKIVPVLGDPYASSKERVEISERTNTGSLRVVTNTTKPSFFIQLLKDGKIVKEVSSKKTILWDELQPGKYQVRILVDENNNGKWDNGSLSNRILPEPVILHPEVFEIRADWEIEVSPPIQF